MKKNNIWKVLSGAVIAATVISMAFTATPVAAAGLEGFGGPGGRGGRGGMGGSGVVTPLSADEQNALKEAILEEYGALNTYEALIAEFGSIYPFNVVVKSEQRHVDTLVKLFERYGVSVPENTGLAAAPQADTVADACAIGVSAEIADADLYTELLKAVTHQDIRNVFTNLQRASLEQHLPAFETCD